jgi:hypothetical protein
VIIAHSRKVRTADPAAFAWSGLRRFQNVDLVTNEIIRAQKVDERWHKNVRKQAQQLRYCLIQAREYFAAAQSVSLATKPNLLYYGTMSLALAEILFKQTGESSLDRARSEHRHHGLAMSVGSIPSDASLQTSSQELRAVPVEINGTRRGTFELWHRTSREHPLAGNATVHLVDGLGVNDRFQSILTAVDTPYASLGTGGVSLAECLNSLPLMIEHVSLSGMTPRFARGKCEMEIWEGENWNRVVTITFHPGVFNEQIFNDLRIEAGMVDRVDIIGGPRTGMFIKMRSDFIYGRTAIAFPPAAMIDPLEWRMWANSPALNEFGYLYAALFLAGNYARYYPDRWLYDVERSTPLSLAIEELCSLAEWRVPWLSLCELGMNMLVNEA